MPAIPKPAASIMLIRDSRAGLEVLMMQRADTMAFAPGAFVFPGGKVDGSDANRARWRSAVDARSWSPDMPYRIAALRELNEEAGIVYARGVNRQVPPSASFGPWLRSRGYRLCTRAMVPFAHWITPEPMPKRYDTHFFVAPTLGVAFEKADGHEATYVKWVNVRRLLAGWEAGKVPLMFPTRLNLMKLAQRDTVAGALAYARRTPVARVLPEITADGKARKVRIAGGIGFGATEATEREMMVEAPISQSSTN